MIIQKSYYINTTEDLDLIDVTHEVNTVIGESKAGQGLVTLLAPLALASFVVLDSRGDGVETFKTELKEFLQDNRVSSSETMEEPRRKGGIGRVRPQEVRASTTTSQKMTKGLYASLMGRDLSLPLNQGTLVMDPWDHVYLLDLGTEGKRRELYVQVMGEAAGAAKGAQGGQGIPLGKARMPAGQQGGPPPGAAVKV